MALRSPRFVDNPRLQRASENNPPLRSGETGEAVRLVQQALIDLGFPMPISIRRYGSPDGIYGNETAGRVREFQTKHGLSPDGVAGRQTLGKLDALLPNPAPPLPPLPAAGKYQYKVRLHLRSINIPHVGEFTALTVAQRVYRQYSIDVEMASGMSLLLTNEEQLKLNVVDGQCKWDQVSDDQRLLQGLGGRQGVGPNDILVYFATTLRQLDGSTLQGCAGHAPNRPAVMIASTAVDKTTMAHEVGHVLLGSSFTPVHVADSNNLMCSAAICTGNPPILTDDQLRAIRSSPYCIKQF
jgi:peptidoglycan hydrolase-like protein with peptidoglycan-binding domain